MRWVRAVAVAAVVQTVAIGVVTFGFGSPALAAPSFAVDHTTVIFVPTIGSAADATQDYTITGDDTNQDFHLHIESDAPAFAPKPAQGPNFTCTASGAIDCDISGVGGTNPVDLRVVYSGAALDDALGQARSKTYATTATLTKKSDGSTAGKITSHIQVRPSADLDVSGAMNVRGLGNGGGAVLEFSVQNRGPSGSITTNVVVTGFRAPPTGLPAGCQAAGNAVRCTYHAAVTQDDSRTLSIPITANEAGCNYTVRVSGAYPDPKTGNNTNTFRNPTLPCGGPTPTGTPTTAPPSPSPSSTPPSVPATPSETESLATIPGGQAGSSRDNDSTGILLIAAGAGGLLVALGLALAYRALRRP